jgi:hypothetical protein
VWNPWLSDAQLRKRNINKFITSETVLTQVLGRFSDFKNAIENPTKLAG